MVVRNLPNSPIAASDGNLRSEDLYRAGRRLARIWLLGLTPHRAVIGGEYLTAPNAWTVNPRKSRLNNPSGAEDGFA
jgi:hypothetical protein